MDKKSIEEIVGRIVEIDRMANQELEAISRDIQEREKQLQSIIDRIRQDSHMLQLEQGKALYEEVMKEAKQEKEKIRQNCLAKMKRMEMEFSNEEETILQKAIQETSIGKWGAS